MRIFSVFPHPVVSSVKLTCDLIYYCIIGQRSLRTWHKILIAYITNPKQHCLLPVFLFLAAALTRFHALADMLIFASVPNQCLQRASEAAKTLSVISPSSVPHHWGVGDFSSCQWGGGRAEQQTWNRDKREKKIPSFSLPTHCLSFIPVPACSYTHGGVGEVEAPAPAKAPGHHP